MSDFLKVLNERTSTDLFDSATPISVQEIKELISEHVRLLRHLTSSTGASLR